MATEEKRKGGFFYKIIILILLCVIAFSLYKVGSILFKYREATQKYKTIEQEAKVKVKGKGDVSVDWDSLLGRYRDQKAWLYQADSVINYPVMQGTDNDYYLHRLPNEEYNFKGSLFVDYRCEKPFKTFMTIIYGHSMRDGSMFHCLKDYWQSGYYDTHKTMTLLTPEQDYTVKVFAAINIDADSEMYQPVFSEKKEKQAYLDTILKNNKITTSVDVSAKDHIVMMSTCTYADDKARSVIFGKLVKKSKKSTSSKK